MERRTRCGKVVGSVRRPLTEWVYWPEANWQTRQPGFMVVAPSGARMEWVESEEEARALVARRNEEEARR